AGVRPGGVVAPLREVASVRMSAHTDQRTVGECPRKMTPDPNSIPADVLALLRCTACGARLEPGGDGDSLRCTACARRVPLTGGIPRFVQRPLDQTARRTQASFGYEWTHFTDWSKSGETN